MSRLRDARIRKGLSQEDLGRRAGVPRPTVARAEGGTHIPEADHAAKLYRAVGLTLDDMLADVGAVRVARERGQAVHKK